MLLASLLNLTLACTCLQGTCTEECQRIEGFFDTARVRIEKLSARLEAADRRFTAERLPWERAVFRNARSATLNLAIIYMSRYASQALCSAAGEATAASALNLAIMHMSSLARPS